MFGLGFWEIAIVALVALVLVKPDDWPALIKALGRFYKRLGQFLRSASVTGREIESALSEPSQNADKGKQEEDRARAESTDQTAQE